MKNFTIFQGTLGAALMVEYFPILVFFVAVLGFAGFSLLAPHVVAPRKQTLVKGMPYESGMDPEGDARKPLDIKFYLLAILFLLFDVELLFVYPWAVAAGSDGEIDGTSRWGVFAVLLLLMATTALAYLYARQKGVFQWRQK